MTQSYKLQLMIQCKSARIFISVTIVVKLDPMREFKQAHDTLIVNVVEFTSCANIPNETKTFSQ